MGVYARFKRGPEGFRALVELLETTPVARRQRMIEVGMAEDPEFTRRALDLMLTFQDVINLPDVELAEVMATAPVRMLGYAIQPLSEAIQQRFLRNARGHVASEVRDYMETKLELREIGGAQLKIVEVARSLERRGLVRTKRIAG